MRVNWNEILKEMSRISPLISSVVISALRLVLVSVYGMEMKWTQFLYLPSFYDLVSLPRLQFSLGLPTQNEEGRRPPLQGALKYVPKFKTILLFALLLSMETKLLYGLLIYPSFEQSQESNSTQTESTVFWSIFEWGNLFGSSGFLIVICFLHSIPLLASKLILVLCLLSQLILYSILASVNVNLPSHVVMLIMGFSYALTYPQLHNGNIVNDKEADYNVNDLDPVVILAKVVGQIIFYILYKWAPDFLTVTIIFLTLTVILWLAQILNVMFHNVVRLRKIPQF